MPLAITIELDDADLKHFIDAMQKAYDNVDSLAPQHITDAAAKLLKQDPGRKLPDFISERLEKLGHLIAMVHDEGFGMPDEDRRRVLACLAYFANPDDLIPDQVPVLGFLDDAVMIVLAVRELAQELDEDTLFVAYRKTEAVRHGVDPASLKTQRVEWAEARRVELIERMRRRRRDSYAGTNAGKWQPTLFRFGG
jgi:uncharacterized membrane protein YkvA (DUF1232 family)